MSSAQNRRQHARVCLPPMYTPIAVRLLHDETFTLEGHTYDISEGGVQFELDKAIAPGSQVVVQIELPVSVGGGPAAARHVFVTGNVVWVDDSEPGPVRLAVAFTRFAREQDRELLADRLSAVRGGRQAA